ncbi:HRDC domain-containing protein [Desulfoluna sp.]|uniref:ribonuclease D n=1 Tax=Desulfoluna sp. TaxID=2045199 RepID=UPI00261EBFC3|nr:HRDC domain-containing protein [Desulfoluna sp.]
MINNLHYIDTTEALEEIADIFLNADCVGVDLEADSMFHFREKVCLIQMAAGDFIAVIDPLAIDDMSSIVPVFERADIRKIFHGSDYDVRSLSRDFDITIRNLFDTELASRFLGIPETGLGSVMKNRFGIEMDKTYQKKDWSKRPLTEGMIAYGAGDVIYLPKLATILDHELEAKGRTAWVQEECLLLSMVRHQDNGDTPLFARVKGAGKLDRRSLAVLEELLQLRYILSEKKDRPPFKVFSNTSLHTLAKEKPLTLSHLKASGALSPRQSAAHGTQVLQAIEKGVALPEEELPKYPRGKRPNFNPDIPQRLDAIKAYRDDLADRLALDPPILVNKALMTAIAVLNPGTVEELHTIDGLRQWQISTLGEGIVNALHSAS